MKEMCMQISDLSTSVYTVYVYVYVSPEAKILGRSWDKSAKVV
jgi:hypothetical protein